MSWPVNKIPEKRLMVSGAPRKTSEDLMDGDRYKLGVQIRREIFGDGYVDQQMRLADAYSRPWQDYVNEFVWGGIWGRPGLSRKTRSLLNLAMLAVLNMPHELKLHIRGALVNGVTKEEIVEVFLQAAMDGGAPTGVQAFSAMREVFAEQSTGTRRQAARRKRPPLPKKRS
jgi:4-carboxymuconolactone decarboxylase